MKKLSQKAGHSRVRASPKHWDKVQIGVQMRGTLSRWV